MDKCRRVDKRSEVHQPARVSVDFALARQPYGRECEQRFAGGPRPGQPTDAERSAEVRPGQIDPFA